VSSCLFVGGCGWGGWGGWGGVDAIVGFGLVVSLLKQQTGKLIRPTEKPLTDSHHQPTIQPIPQQGDDEGRGV